MLSDKQKKDDYLARTRRVRYRLQYKQRKKREDYQKQRGRMGTKNARHRSQVTLRKKRGDKLKQKQRGRGGDQRPPRLKVFLRFRFIAAPPRHQGERKREVGRSGNKSKCFKKWSVLSSDAFSDPSSPPFRRFFTKDPSFSSAGSRAVLEAHLGDRIKMVGCPSRWFDPGSAKSAKFGDSITTARRRSDWLRRPDAAEPDTRD